MSINSKSKLQTEIIFLGKEGYNFSSLETFLVHQGYSYNSLEIESIEPISNFKNCVLIISTHFFTEIFDRFKNFFINFLNENRVILYQEIDSIVILHKFIRHNPEILNFDQKIKKDSLVIMLDGQIKSEFVQFNNIKIVEKRINKFINIDRISWIEDGDVSKNKNSKEFLLTTIAKTPGLNLSRLTLKELLSQKNYLYNHGICKISDSRSLSKESWIGNLSFASNWNDGHASMDLYNNCFIEVVPETFDRDCYFITEKTIKPIITKTPFLMISTEGYLKYLRDLGFKTFHTLIDESYDEEPDPIKRTEMVINLLESIIKTNTAQDFYNSASDILQHNQDHLFYLSGKFNYYHTELFTSIFNK